MRQTPKDIKKKLAKHAILQAVIRTGRTNGYVLTNMTAMEKWNYTGDKVDVPGPDGHFDVEGQNSADVNVFYSNRFGWSFAKAVARWTWELVTSRDWGMAKVTHPFNRTWESWLFVVDSYTAQSWGYAEETVHVLFPGLNRTDFKRFWAEVARIQKTITHEQIGKYLKYNDYWELRKGFYLNRSDPTCMVVDDSHYKFDMRDGWSSKMITLIINMWFCYVTGDLFLVKEEKRDTN